MLYFFLVNKTYPIMKDTICVKKERTIMGSLVAFIFLTVMVIGLINENEL